MCFQDASRLGDHRLLISAHQWKPRELMTEGLRMCPLPVSKAIQPAGGRPAFKAYGSVLTCGLIMTGYGDFVKQLNLEVH